MRIVPALLVIALAFTPLACNRKNRVRVQETEEEAPTLATMLHVADPRATPQLLSGWHAVEQNAWRWTTGNFSVLLHPPRQAAEKGALLQLKFSIPEVVLTKLKSLTLTATVDKTALSPETYTQPGEFTYSREVPGKLLAAQAVKVEFALDKTLKPGDSDQRELGVVASTVGFEVK